MTQTVEEYHIPETQKHFQQAEFRQQSNNQNLQKIASKQVAIKKAIQITRIIKQTDFA